LANPTAIVPKTPAKGSTIPLNCPYLDDLNILLELKFQKNLKK